MAGTANIDFGEVLNAAQAGQFINNHFASNALQAQLGAIAQEANSGTVEGLDGKKYAVNTAAGQQAMRARTIAAYTAFGGRDGQALGTDSRAMYGQLSGQRNETGVDQVQAGALALPTDPAGGYSQIATGHAIQGDAPGAQVYDEQAATTRAMNAPIPNASSDPTTLALQQQQRAAQAVQTTGNRFGDPARTTAGTQAYLQGTSQLAAQFAGKAVQAFQSNNPDVGVAQVNSLVSLYPSLLPKGADPTHPFQYDAANGMLMATANGQPIAGPDGKPEGIPLSTVQQMLPALAQRPDQIPQMLMGFLQQKIGAAQKMLMQGTQAAEKGVTAGTSAISGFTIGAMLRSAQGAGAVRAASGLEQLKLASPTGTTGTSGPQTLLTVTPNGQAVSLTVIPGGVNQQTGVFEPPTIHATLPNGQPYNGPLRGAGGTAISTQQASLKLVNALMKMQFASRAQGAQAALGYANTGADTIMSMPNPNFGLPTGSVGGAPQNSAIPTPGQPSAPGASSPAVQWGGNSLRMFSTLTADQFGASTPKPPTSLYSIVPTMESNNNPTQGANGKGAIGEWQVEPSTAAPLVQKLIKSGLLPKGTTPQQALSDPNTNRAIGASLLSTYYAKYATRYTPSQATAATLVAYNAGEGVANAWVKGTAYKSGSGVSFKPSHPFDMRALPAETRAYVQRGLAATLGDSGPTVAQAPPAALPAAPTAAAPTPVTLPGMLSAKTMSVSDWATPTPASAP